MKKSILVLDDVIKDVSVLERISTLKVPTGTFIRKNEVLEPSDSNELNLLKRVIGEVWFNAAFDVISPIEDSLVGFEVWVNSLPDDFSREYLAGGMGGLNYHIDKDENALANSNGKNLIPSLYAATLYVSPDESEMVGGDIYVDTSGLDNYYKYYKGNQVIDLNTGSWVKIPFKKNRLVIFDGTYPHFVDPIIDIKKNSKRVGIQINPWDRELEKPNEV